MSADALPSLAARLARRIAADGPIGVADYMAAANAHYYGTRDPLGAAGDFTTAPEISQMFGELIGLWLADLWLRSGGDAGASYAELGPGRGTLAADALRAMARAALVPPVHLVETSPTLRARQLSLLPSAVHHDDVAGLPADGPLLVVANEFFDALPVVQAVRVGDEWRERVVVTRAGDQRRFLGVPGIRRIEGVPAAIAADAPEGAILEVSPLGVHVAGTLAQRIAAQGGAAIIVDYGHAGPAIGDTLQAVKAQGFADPFADPGEHDLTAHVDFTPLGEVARRAGLRVYQPVEQGPFLQALGIDARAAELIRANPAREEAVAAARHRLVDEGEMGSLFKVMAWVHPDWPDPAGFADQSS
ncbi:MAG: SAM-dependent methyltransferase [Sphingobium sp.]